MERTQQPPDQPTPAPPRPNQILAEPATVGACQRDYASPAAIRVRHAAQHRGQR